MHLCFVGAAVSRTAAAAWRHPVETGGASSSSSESEFAILWSWFGLRALPLSRAFALVRFAHATLTRATWPDYECERGRAEMANGFPDACGRQAGKYLFRTRGDSIANDVHQLQSLAIEYARPERPDQWSSPVNKRSDESNGVASSDHWSVGWRRASGALPKTHCWR